MIDERQHLLQEIHQYEHDTKEQADRIKELEEAIQEFCIDAEQNMNNAWGGVYYKRFKQLLDK